MDLILYFYSICCSGYYAGNADKYEVGDHDGSQFKDLWIECVVKMELINCDNCMADIFGV